MVIGRVKEAILIAGIIILLAVIGISLLFIGGSNLLVSLIAIIFLLAAYLLYRRGA